MASVPSASSSATLAASLRLRSPIRPTQPPSLKLSTPAGSWITPSSVMFSLITIFPISVLVLWVLSGRTNGCGCGRLPTCVVNARTFLPIVHCSDHHMMGPVDPRRVTDGNYGRSELIAVLVLLDH